jgi:hypothetical protein
MAQVRIGVYDGNGTLAGSFLSTSTGRYSADGLPAGNYYARTFNVLGLTDVLYGNAPCTGNCNVLSGTPIAVNGTPSGPTANFMLGLNATGLSIVDAPHSSTIGQSVTVTATLTPSGATTGTITVTASNSGGCVITLPQTSCALSFTAIGSQTIDASYSGNATFGPSTASTSHTVINSLPTVSAPAAQSVLEDAVSSPIGITVGDLETSSGALVLTATSSNTAVIPASGIVLGGSGSARTLTATPVPDAFGATTITLTVADGNGGTAMSTFDITVTSVNDAPSFSVSGDLVDAPGSGSRSVPGFVTSFSPGPANESGQTVASYDLVVDDPVGVVSGVTIAANGTLSYTRSGLAGTATVTAKVRDSGGTSNGGVDLSAPVVFHLTVLADGVFRDGFE